MSTEQILTIFMSILGGGGFVAIIQAIAGRRKNKSEVTDILVKKAIELESVASARYIDVSRTLETAERYLAEAKLELEVYRSYVSVLTDLCRNHGITIPEIHKGGKVIDDEPI